ncbi:hypothetical protein P171DRAFT_446901 [Karstenula rhodostoma CBS 690.94]|uniref:Uncharacterized protein n=1 Tax=Karstenula rhodostoma CBS 690.94 TaxID=1392251 RepID=A0A9P4U8K4_9PLEO|nr:hypothetical protein P171DRAFT_446901 [Karstenula rhodostoma CBS 690.94]
MTLRVGLRACLWGMPSELQRLASCEHLQMWCGSGRSEARGCVVKKLGGGQPNPSDGRPVEFPHAPIVNAPIVPARDDREPARRSSRAPISGLRLCCETSFQIIQPNGNVVLVVHDQRRPTPRSTSSLFGNPDTPQHGRLIKRRRLPISITKEEAWINQNIRKIGSHALDHSTR